MGWGGVGRRSAGNDHSFWARIRIQDLKYTQDSRSEVFSRTAELNTYEARSIHKLCHQLGDDPDEVLSALAIWPEVVVIGERVHSMNNAEPILSRTVLHQRVLGFG